VRIVWASAHLPDPGRGGGWAFEYEVLRHAANHHDVLLLSGELAAGEAVPPILTELGIEVRGVAAPPRPIPLSKAGFLAHMVRHRMPLGVWTSAPTIARLRDAVARAEAEGRVDLVHVMPQEAAAIAAATHAPSALYLGDSFAVQAERELAHAQTPKDRLRLTLERRNSRAWERRWYPQASAVACVSPADATALRALCGIPIDAIPLSIGDEWFASPTTARSRHTVALIGALDYRPNVDGVVWFANDVWPLVRARVPDARLQIVGRRPTAEVIDAVAVAGGDLSADVPDVRPYYWGAAVVVAPIRLGSGVKNKVLHAAACGAPQVGTTFAFDGTGARSGEDVLMADDAVGLADAIAATLADPDAAARRATAARGIAEAHRAGRLSARLDDFWQRAASAGPRSGPAT
jgi:glycosyltransferase involved in cell wall biosynthesis